MDNEKFIAQEFWLLVRAAVLLVLTFAIMIWGMVSARKALWAAIEGKLPITKQDEQLLARATADEALHQRLIEEFGKKQKWLGAFIAAPLAAMMAICAFAALLDVKSPILLVLMAVGAIALSCVGIPMKRINRQWLLLKDLRKKLDRW